MENDLVTVIAQGSMKALALHANDLKIDGNTKLPALRKIILTEYKELMEVLKNAYDSHMGDAMYRQIINTYCNAWAVQALKS